MTQPNPSTALARVVIDELARHGVELVVLSPGSRSGALAIAAAEHERVSERVVIDERSAAFHALGRSKATGVPSAVISTSGSAPANFMPAVVEADMALTPLIVISADRPVEMRGVGANQTINQVGLFGPKVRFAADIEAPDDDTDSNDVWRSTVSSAVGAALGSKGMPGPVHLNIAFREPTVPISDDGRSQAGPYPHPIEGKSGGGPWATHDAPPAPDPQLEIPASSRGLVIAGEGAYDGDALREAATVLGWPVLATALSGLRGEDTVSSYHHLLADGVPDHLQPEIVVAIGAVGPSSRLEDLIASARFRFRVDALGRNIDPGRNATSVIHANPVQVLGRVVAGAGEGGWVHGWAKLDADARLAYDDYLSGLTEPSGAGVVTRLNHASWDVLVAASSLPIREVDAHLTRPGRVIANRGASGIDGFVSTALGVASTGPGALAVCGDLSLLHDSNGFLTDVPEDLVLVVLDNDGGGLFDSLPQAIHAPQFERLFITPHGRRLRDLAAFHEIGYAEVDDESHLAGLIDERQSDDGVHIIRVPVDRRHDLGVRQALDGIGAEVARSAEL